MICPKKRAKMSYRVKQHESGSWLVVNGAGLAVESCASNREAWRRADILNREAENKSQDTAMWAFNRDASK